MSYGIPDDPIIQNMERSGYPDGKEPPQPICPVCGEVCETVYREFGTDEIIGCNECICAEDAWNWPGCFPSEE